jgi:phage N-6-adenine-methyltransferase
MSGHQSARMKSDTWLTPPEIIKALGEFDLDPCCPPVMPWPTAAKYYSKVDDGLSQEWEGRVWLNPPYSKEAVKWLRKLADHGQGTALVFARTETAWFFETVWRKATSVLFLEGRLYFHLPDGSKADGNAGAPSCLVAYGEVDDELLISSGIRGHYVRIKAKFDDE